MENINEVMVNEMDEVMFVAESITPKTGKGLKIVGGTALAVAVGYGIYRGGKWIVGKIKPKKEQGEVEAENETSENVAD